MIASSSKRIFSPCMAVTDVLYGHNITPLHQNKSLQEYLLDFKHLSWPEPMFCAKKMFYCGEACTLPNEPGVFYMLPELKEEWGGVVDEWAKSGDDRQVIEFYPVTQPTVQQFSSIDSELQFALDHPEAIVITTDQVFLQRLRWARRDFNKYPEWQLAEDIIYNPTLAGMSFLDRLEQVAPNKNIVYDTLYAIGHGPFTTVLRDVLHMLEHSSNLVFYGYFTSRPIILARFDSSLSYIASRADCVCTSSYNICNQSNSQSLKRRITVSQLLKLIHYTPSKRDFSVYRLAAAIINRRLSLDQITNYLPYSETYALLKKITPYNGIIDHIDVEFVYKYDQIEIAYKIDQIYQDGTHVCFASAECGAMINWIHRQTYPLAKILISCSSGLCEAKDIDYSEVVRSIYNNNFKQC